MKTRKFNLIVDCIFFMLLLIILTSIGLLTFTLGTDLHGFWEYFLFAIGIFDCLVIIIFPIRYSLLRIKKEYRLYKSNKPVKILHRITKKLK